MFAMKFSLATLVAYFLVCLITAEDYEAGHTKSSWSSSAAARPDARGRATLENVEPTTYSTPGIRPTAVQPAGQPTPIGNKGRPGPYHEDGYYANSRNTLFGKGSRWRGPRCAVEPPSEECTGGITMWFYDPENKTCAAHEVGNCFRLGFFFCRVCVASCMGIFWRHQEIQDICQLAD
uniref:Pancreatic trypsin inhibitor n=1 Tax=Rhipicephalus zambeziensis TaxID=60191 RepID=A0A224YCW6_9ACAR